jgi:hypothetical protein
MQEIKITLREVDFINVCKTGTINYNTGYNKLVAYISKIEMKKLALGELVEKEVEGEVFNIIVSGIDIDMIKEILRRSPIFSDLFYEI